MELAITQSVAVGSREGVGCSSGNGNDICRGRTSGKGSCIGNGSRSVELAVAKAVGQG